MAVLVDNSSGMAVDLPLPQAQQALSQGTHAVPLNDPQGNPVVVPYDQASSLVQQGFTQPAPDQLQNLLTYSQRSTPGEMAKTALEGAGSSATFGLSTGLEKMAGVKPEDIRERAEANPKAHLAGEMAGIVGSGFLPKGLSAAHALTEVGEAAAGAAGLVKAEGMLQHVARGAIKTAAESMAMQAGNEMSKRLSEDPNQTVESALVGMGLAGVLGGAVGGMFGATSPLAEALHDSKIGKFIDDFKGRMEERAGKSLGVEVPKAPHVDEEMLSQVEGKAFAPFTKKVIPRPEVELSGAKSSTDPFTGEPTALKTAPIVDEVAPQAAPEAQGKLTPGQRAADWLWSKGASKLASESAGGALGAMVGHHTGIPGAGMVGAWFGNKAIAPVLETVLPALTKPILNSPALPQAMRTAVDLAAAALKGETLMNKAALALFKPGAVIDQDVPKKLTLALERLTKKPESMLDMGGQLAHYLPDHATSLSMTANRAVSYLDGMKPKPTKGLPLDPDFRPDASHRSKYDRALAIANQPLAILQHVKDGTITVEDIKTLNTVYPGLYPKLQQKALEAMIDHTAKGELVPYTTRLGLSMFLGTPLDSSMTPAAIKGNQRMSAEAPQPLPHPPTPKGSMKALQTLPASYSTPGQAREQSRQKPR